MANGELKPKDLKNVCDISVFPFKTTEDYVFEHEPLHQERGVGAIDFGLNIKSDGYNIFACGAAGTGRNTQVNKLVNEIAATQKPPNDWVYVYNFVHEDEPVAISLPPGRGRIFKKDMEELINELKVEIPKAFESEDYEKRKHDLLREYKQKRDEVLQDIEDKAHDEGFVLKQSATGVILVPRSGEDPMPNEEYDMLPEEERQRIEKKKHELHIKIEQVLSEVRTMEKDAKNKIRDLEKEIALFAVKHIIDELRFKYREFEDVVQHLNLAQEDLIESLDIFKEEEEEGAMGIFGMKGAPKKNQFLKYQVNLLVDRRHAEGAPVVREVNPTYYNLVGRIEYASYFGSMTTNFTMIGPGALHKANGGYLILQVMDVLKNYMSWDALKRVIRNREISVEDINEQIRLISTSGLKPKSIPCDIKIIMVGPPWLYQLLYKYDEDFRKMFKVKADFDIEMDRDVDKVKKYSAFIKVRCEEENLRHFSREAVAEVIEYGSRLTGDKEKLSAKFMYVADILREANYWAGKDHAQYVEASHVEKAMKEKVYRSNLIEEKISEYIEKNVLMIDVEGARVGQVNGLAVLDIGEYAFGKPSRITSRTFMGKAGVIDIERQVKMGGNIHSKGVLILSGYLGERFAQDIPLSLSASICFEQSYEGIEGDSASSTEAYCLLSSLSGVPIKQCIGVTGSMNQHGVIQPIGGVNEKIEGFYHSCKVKGLTGEQGVMIPQSNVRHLMLKDEVIEAVKKGKFHVWPVSTIDEGIEILTGKKAGKRDAKGKYPKGTINYLAEKKLQEYSKKLVAKVRKGAKETAKTKKKKRTK
ncbi:MAG: ATP-binding protein [Candidatus Omnitrophota bacterium]